MTEDREPAQKLRESGMPEEACWETLMDVPLVLDRLQVDHRLQAYGRLLLIGGRVM